MNNPFQLTLEAKALVDDWEANDGELTQDIQARLDEMYSRGLVCAIEFANILSEREAMAEAYKAKAKQFADWGKKADAMANTIKAALTRIMQTTGQSKYQNEAVSITLNKGRESVEIVDEKAVPDSYKIVEVSILASKIDYIQLALDKDDILSISEPKISKTMIKRDSDQNIGIAGTEIVRKPYITIKGA